MSKKTATKVDEKLLTVRISYNDNSNRFFVDFWDVDPVSQEKKCLISMSISKAEAEGISREIGVKILVA